MMNEMPESWKPFVKPEASTALALAERGSLLPVFAGSEMAAALVAYKELQHALDAAMPDQIMDIRGKPFRRKGYWRAVARAFKLNLECRKEESDDFGWRVVYRATSPNGQFAEGDGACENEEKGEGQDTEHNVRSHAHTRAFNRAVSNLVGFGEVSAEETTKSGGRVVSGVIVEPAAPAKPDAPAPSGYVYIFKYWKEYEWHHVLLPDASGGHTWELKTKNPQVGELASQAFQQGTPVKVEPDRTSKWLNKIHLYCPPLTDAEQARERSLLAMARDASEIA